MKGVEVGKGEWEAEDLHKPNETKRWERDYNGEGIELLNLFKLLLKEAPTKSPQP